MAYIAPIHHSSSVRHALKLRLLDPDEYCLVLAKANRIEIYTLSPAGLSLHHSKTIHGKVTMLSRLRPAKSRADHLFIGTDRFMYFTLSWNPEARQLQTEKSYVDQADKSARDSQTGDRCSMDFNGKFLLLEVYEGCMTIIPIAQKPGKSNTWEVGNLADPIQLRIAEMFVRASTFCESATKLRDNRALIALLHEDTQKQMRLRIRPLVYTATDLGAVDLETGAETVPEELELGASHLIPVPAPIYGLIILGEVSISYYEHTYKTYVRAYMKEATIFISWERIDAQRYLLADEYGKLYMLMLKLGQRNEVVGWDLEMIGRTSRASTMVYLDSGRVFVGSNQGDCQLIDIKPGGIEVVQVLPNLGPILDFSIMDLGNRNAESQVSEFSSGQARLVMGSGAFNDGSLRSVRSGVGLEDLGQIGEMENITNLFSIMSTSRSLTSGNLTVNTLIVSFISETRIFRFGTDGSVEEVDDFVGCAFDTETLLAASDEANLVQVTKLEARLCFIDAGEQFAQWAPPSGQSITLASFSGNILAICYSGSNVVLLDAQRKFAVIATRSFGENQVACLHVPPKGPSICIVGFWDSHDILFLSTETLETRASQYVSSEGVVVPRSLLLVQLLEGQDPTLLIAMADGNVITYSVEPNTLKLSGRRAVLLDAEQAQLHALEKENGLYNVFATCKNPSLIYGSEGRLVYSAVTADDAVCVCHFNNDFYPHAIAIATSKELKIAVADEQRTTHVQALHLGETVRRVAYSPEFRAFGLGTIRRTLQGGTEVVKSHFKLADEASFSVEASWALNDEEIVESVIRCQLADDSGRAVEHFVVGTAYIDEERGDSVRGRIVVLEVTLDRQLKVVVDHDVRGACRCLAVSGKYLVAGLIKIVMVFELVWDTASSPRLKKIDSFRTSTAPIDLAVHAPTSTIAVADLMKSLSLLHLNTQADGGPALEEVARHFQTTWATACAFIAQPPSPPEAKDNEPEDSLFLESDAEGNLLLLQRDTKSDFADDRRRLKAVAEMSLGEMVNKIRAFHPAAASPAVVYPRAFVATVDGGIYLFGLVDASKVDFLLRLQQALVARVPSLGDVPFHKYRALHDSVREAAEPYRFVDGELVDSFLELPAAAQEDIVRELGPTLAASGVAGGVDGLRSLVEGLRRLR